MKKSEPTEAEVLSTARLLECRVFDVQASMIQQNGVVYKREFINHKGSGVVIPVFGDGSIALVEQYRHPAGKPLLELPAGSLEEGESPEECAQREIVEETGFRAGKLEKLTEFWVSPGFLSEKMHVFIATDLTPAHAEPDEDEFLRVKILDIETAMGMVRENAIEDAKTMIGILLSYPVIKGL